jgi:hypothetical protein
MVARKSKRNGCGTINVRSSGIQSGLKFGPGVHLVCVQSFRSIVTVVTKCAMPTHNRQSVIATARIHEIHKSYSGSSLTTSYGDQDGVSIWQIISKEMFSQVYTVSPELF